jgi:hypothetical protein
MIGTYAYMAGVATRCRRLGAGTTIERAYGLFDADNEAIAGMVEIARLAHVPEKWEPVFRKGHAPLNESRERISIRPN